MVQDVVCVLQTLRAASRLVTRRYEAALRPTGLTASQFSILQTLNTRESLCPSDISDALGFDQTTVTRLIATMERQGLIKVTPDAQDRRKRHIARTKIGSEKYAQALPIWQELQTNTLTHVSSRDWSTVRQFLHHLTHQ